MAITHHDHLIRIAKLVRGEFAIDLPTRNRAAYDGSIFTIQPEAVFFPKDGADVQSLLHYLYVHAAAGESVPSVTARGRGSDQAGGPLGSGIIIDCTRHLNQILEVGADFVRVEPGLRYGELQEELKKRGRYLPPYPASLEICTIGGAVANNSSGEKTVKYGDTREYVQSLKVVLASGQEVFLAGRTQKELKEVSQQPGFEGGVYRQMAELLGAHRPQDEQPGFEVTKNATGYAVWEVEQGQLFDLARLIVGSQGTLGIVTEITLRTNPYPREFALIAGYFDSIEKAALATGEILELGPSALEIVDRNLIALVEERQPGHLKGLLPEKLPEVVLVIEFDDSTDRARTNKARAAETILQKYAYEYKRETDPIQQDRLWSLRRSAAAVIWTVSGSEKALPIVEDGVVPPHKLPEFFERAYALFERYGVRIAVWGHAGDANLHMQPFMDLSHRKDREKIWPFVDDFHALIMEMGGCISAEHNDGLLRSPYLKAQYGPELYGIFEKVKQIFDPYGFLNPGKKVGVTIEQIKPLLRHSYSLDHLVQDAEQINR